MNKFFNRILAVMLVLVAMIGIMMPVQATEDWVDPIPAERIIYDIRAKNIHLPNAERAGDALIADLDSPFGEAVRFSYADRAAVNDQGLMDAMRYVGDQAMKLRVYCTEPAEDRELLVISQAQLRANSQGGKYVTYHVEDVTLFTNTNQAYLYMFDCWSLQVHLTEAQREAIMNQQVDIYMSLKVTGDFSVTEGNTVSYYIDRIVIATAEEGTEQHDHEIGTWQRANDYTHEASCQIPGCGEVISEDHEWDEGVVTKEPTKSEVGIQTYTCAKCQATKTKKLPAGTAVSKPGKDSGSDGGAGLNPLYFVAGGLFLLAIVIIVVAVVLKKKGKK